MHTPVEVRWRFEYVTPFPESVQASRRVVMDSMEGSWVATSTISSTGATQTHSGDGAGLSSGAKAGIGVGIAVVGLTIALAVSAWVARMRLLV